MNKLKLIGLIFALLFGPFLFVYGGYDDSPGGQGLGLLLFVIGLVGLIRRKRRAPGDRELEFF